MTTDVERETDKRKKRRQSDSWIGSSDWLDIALDWDEIVKRWYVSLPLLVVGLGGTIQVVNKFADTPSHAIAPGIWAAFETMRQSLTSLPNSLGAGLSPAEGDWLVLSIATVSATIWSANRVLGTKGALAVCALVAVSVGAVGVYVTEGLGSLWSPINVRPLVFGASVVFLLSTIATPLGLATFGGGATSVRFAGVLIARIFTVGATVIGFLFVFWANS